MLELTLNQGLVETCLIAWKSRVLSNHPLITASLMLCSILSTLVPRHAVVSYKR